MALAAQPLGPKLNPLEENEGRAEQACDPGAGKVERGGCPEVSG